MERARAGRLRHRQEHQQPLLHGQVHGHEPVQEDPSAPVERWTRLVRTWRPIACLRRIWANQTKEEIGGDTVRGAPWKSACCSLK